MTYRFEDYDIKTGKLRHRPGYWASIEEFASLIAEGQTEQELIARVKAIYGVDITSYYDRPLPIVLKIISEKGGE